MAPAGGGCYSNKDARFFGYGSELLISNNVWLCYLTE